MFDTVVWASDGSEHAARALPLARALLNGERSLLIAVHVVETTASSERGDITEDSGLAGAVAELTEEGVRAALRVISHTVASPAHAIAEVAREVDADAIVVGTRGLSPMAGLLVGSVTQRLLGISPCPVIAVPPAVGSIRTDSLGTLAG